MLLTEENISQISQLGEMSREADINLFRIVPYLLLWV